MNERRGSVKMQVAALKQCLYYISPPIYTNAARIYQRLPHVKQRNDKLAEQSRQEVARKLDQRLRYEVGIVHEHLNGDWTVRHGPFAGMSYAPITSNSLLSPKVIGSYESPIHRWIGDAINRNYRTIVDVGCAEGYYAVGFAVKSKTAQVYAYDIDAEARENTAALARLNGVSDRVQVGDRCTPDELNRVAADNALVFCDIEGGEFDLLRTDLAPSLLYADLIVETHDNEGPGSTVTETLVRRFSPSHRIEAAYHCAKSAAEFSILGAIPATEHALLLEEGRPPRQCWLRLTANPPGAIQPVPWW